ncbi:Putative 2'-deoxynucleoside 5'-phosphate N-hydrolase 1 (fragment) [uncultured Sporomusa sp.]|uniref:Putative 2'-deoxynucleoside 5'-phosphate N-hydrolase 1 n=1 Tax=uncultured Sporomusa sp. TaxID=307249 RepID=A0A212LY98_9FIRM
MNIYFAGSIRGERQPENVETFKRIIDVLKKYGTVLTEHVGDSKLTSTGEKLPDCEIFNRDIKWLENADLVVAEVTSPNLGVTAGI